MGAGELREACHDDHEALLGSSRRPGEVSPVGFPRDRYPAKYHDSPLCGWKGGVNRLIPRSWGSIVTV